MWVKLVKKLLVIGAGKYQLPGIIKAKEMGLEVIVTDYDSNAIGFKHCDHFYVIDVKDKEENLIIAKKHSINGVVSFESEVTVRTVAYIAEKLNLPGIDLETALNATSKLRMRKLFKKFNAPSVDFFEITSLGSLYNAADALGFPFVLKPADSSGSRGVKIIDSVEDIPDAYRSAVDYSTSGTCIAEMFFEGIECTIEGFSYKGDHTILAISQKKKPETKYRVATELFYPPTFSDETITDIKFAVNSAVKALGINDAMTHTEVIVNDKGDLILVEVAARGGGFNISNKIIECITGFDPISALIKLSIGEDINIDIKTQNSAILKFYAPNPGILEKIEGIGKLKEIKNTEVDFLIKEGEIIPPLMTDGSRTASLISWGKTREEVINQVKQVENIIKFKISALDCVIVSFGNNQYGLGHLSRIRSLISLLKTNNFKIITIQNVNPFNLSDISIKNEKTYEKYLKIVSDEVQKINSHILLLDLPFNDILLNELPNIAKSDFNRKVIALDYFDYQSNYIDVAINLVNHNLTKLDNVKIVLHSGIEYAIIREAFWLLRKEFKKEKEDFDLLDVLISFGGSDPKGLTKEGIKLCENWKKMDINLNITIVLGAFSKVNIKGDHTILRSPPDFPSILAKSDIALTSGGITSLEACFVGTPIVVFPQVPEHKTFFKWLENQGLAVCFDSPDLIKILNNNFRERMITNQMQKVDGKGAIRIIAIIKQILNSKK